MQNKKKKKKENGDKRMEDKSVTQLQMLVFPYNYIDYAVWQMR